MRFECSLRESNAQAVRHGGLSSACIPFHQASASAVRGTRTRRSFLTAFSGLRVCHFARTALCTGRASNPQDRSRCFLRAVRLPVSPPVHGAKCENRTRCGRLVEAVPYHLAHFAWWICRDSNTATMLIRRRRSTRPSRSVVVKSVRRPRVERDHGAYKFSLSTGTRRVVRAVGFEPTPRRILNPMPLPIGLRARCTGQEDRTLLAGV